MPEKLAAVAAIAPRRGPVAGEGPRLSIVQRPLSGAIDLRLDPGDGTALDRVTQCLGAGLPLVPEWTEGNGVTAVWQAFDEWLLLVADGGEGELIGRLRVALADCHAAVTDVSDLYVELEIGGPCRRDLLAKGCAVDFHPRAFAARSCAVTALGRVRVTLRQTGNAPAYRVLVERSHAQYLCDWLADAAREFA